MQTEIQGSETHEIPINLIDPDPSQPRQTFVERTIEELAESISHNTLVQPLLVREHPETPGRFMLIWGERRLRAHQLLQERDPERWTTVRCGVLKDGAVDVLTLQLLENLQREDLNSVDEAKVLRRLRDERHMTIEGIHQLTGRAVDTITSRLKLLELPEEIQAMVREGRLPTAEALRLAQFRTRKGQLVKLAYALVHGERPLELVEAGLGRGHVSYRDQIRASKTPGTPADYLRRLIFFESHARAGIRAMKALMALPPEERDPVWQPLHSRSIKYLSQLFEDLIRTATAFSGAMGTWGGKAEPIPTRPQLPVSPIRPETVIPPPAVRRTSADQSTFRAVERRAFPELERPPLPAPVVVESPRHTEAVPPRTPSGDGNGSGQVAQQSVPVPQRREREPLAIAGGPKSGTPFSQEPAGLTKRYLLVLRLMVANPKRHQQRVNLSKSRLTATTAFSRDVIEGVALGALRLVWRCWDEDLKFYLGPTRELLDLVAQMKTEFGSAFSEAMNAIWQEDQSPDPIDLAKL